MVVYIQWRRTATALKLISPPSSKELVLHLTTNHPLCFLTVSLDWSSMAHKKPSQRRFGEETLVSCIKKGCFAYQGDMKIRLPLLRSISSILTIQLPPITFTDFVKCHQNIGFQKKHWGHVVVFLHFVDSYLELTNDKWHLLYDEIADDKNTVLPSYVVMPFMYVYLGLCSLFVPHITRDSA